MYNIFWTISDNISNRKRQSATVPDTQFLSLSLSSVLWHCVFWSLYPSLSSFSWHNLSRSLALINSSGLQSDAFQAPSSYHRLGLGRTTGGILTQWIEAQRKDRTFFKKDQDTSFSQSCWYRECRKSAWSLWSSEEQKWFYLFDRDTTAFTEHNQDGEENGIFLLWSFILVQNK